MPGVEKPANGKTPRSAQEPRTFTGEFLRTLWPGARSGRGPSAALVAEANGNGERGAAAREPNKAAAKSALAKKVAGKTAGKKPAKRASGKSGRDSPLAARAS